VFDVIMSIFAISDLHLSFYKDKPMDIFGENWKNHSNKIKKNWIEYVGKNDTIIIPGDVSWAKNMTEFMPDIEFINSLPGTKIFVSGNHDYWWNSTSALNDLYNNMFFIKNSFYPLENFALCGTRGWLCPNDTFFTSHDEKIYKREVSRLKTSLDLAISAGFSEIVVMTHYPVTNDKRENSSFVDVIKKYPVKKVIYGHLHGIESFYSSFMGIVDGIEYVLVSADFLNFKPVKIF